MRAARAISALVQAMPFPEAGTRERLAWLEWKVRVFEEIAADHATVVADATAYVDAARDEVRVLREVIGAAAEGPSAPERHAEGTGTARRRRFTWRRRELHRGIGQ